VGVVLLLNCRAGVDPAELARRVRQAVVADGADATTVRDLLDAQFARNEGFLFFALTLLRAGFLIGVFSLGAIALRAAGERRRLIAQLRLLGYRPGQVVAGLIAETILGMTAGVVVGLAVGYGIGIPAFTQQALGALWPDPGTMATALTFIYAAVLVVTIGPAVRAVHRPPAEATRAM
jgi:ABC-type antimicrobial peptide transport system permease subunit